jgi:hypothetical protein
LPLAAVRPDLSRLLALLPAAPPSCSLSFLLLCVGLLVRFGPPTDGEGTGLLPRPSRPPSSLACALREGEGIDAALVTAGR